MVINDIAPNLTQQVVKVNDKPQVAEQPPETIPAAQDKSLHRKSIFTDHTGVLVAQVKDNTGEVIASYPSNEALRRYHSLVTK